VVVNETVAKFEQPTERMRDGGVKKVLCHVMPERFYRASRSLIVNER
jgi:hypothetical protein